MALPTRSRQRLPRLARSWPQKSGKRKIFPTGTGRGRAMAKSNGGQWRALRHGSVWWAVLPSPAGRRPVLVLTRDTVLGRIGNITVAPLTRTDRHLPTEVRLTPADGLPKRCVVSLDNILTIQLHLNQQKIAQVHEAIKIALQIA